MKAIKFAMIGLFLVLAGCATTSQPTLTPLELQSLQTRDYEHSKDIVFSSVVSVFQDLGYSVKNANLDTGFISAESTAKTNTTFKLFRGFSREVNQTTATSFIEVIGNVTRARLSFVVTSDSSSASAQPERQDKQILDLEIYKNAFERVESAIFLRSAHSE